MPLIKRQSNESKKRLQHQLYLARECPDSVFDISKCEISEVPSGVFSICKVLQKEALLMHTNWLSSLKGAGKFSDLSGIRILDLHVNCLTSLPDEIGILNGLQVLNLECNFLKSLPATVGELRSLQTLNCRKNRLKAIPDEICRLNSLRILDLSSNSISSLPKNLWRMQTLETMAVDAEKMIFPASGVCREGTEAIMKFLCSESNVEYYPPSKVLLDTLPTPPSLKPGFNRCRSFSANESMIADTVMEYENLKERRRQERLALERQLEDGQRQQALLAAQAAADKNHLVRYMAQEQARMHLELAAAHQQKEIEREKLLETLSQVEKNASELVMKLLAMNEKARKTEELLEQMEKERIEVEQWYTVRQEELENIRRQDVLVSMKQILEHNDRLGSAIQKYLNNHDDAIRRSRSMYEETDDLMESLLNTKHSQQQQLIQKLLQEETLQKEAFEALQCQKDARHMRITGQIKLIEQELSELTMLEMEQRSIKLNTQMNVLEEKRKALTQLLLQLLEERDRREAELRERLREMEEQRLANQTDYWLVQYQRLLDSKPQSLIDQERHVEYVVIEILERAGAVEYLPQFALHRITIETLLQMKDGDFARIGVHEENLRQNLTNEIDEFKRKKMFEGKTIYLDVPTAKQGFTRQRIPSAPPFTDHDSLELEEVEARGINSQCVVCLDAQSEILFLNCGHICVCVKCAEPLKECPLDRSEIVQRIHILPPSPCPRSPCCPPSPCPASPYPSPCPSPSADEDDVCI